MWPSYSIKLNILTIWVTEWSNTISTRVINTTQESKSWQRGPEFLRLKSDYPYKIGRACNVVEGFLDAVTSVCSKRDMKLSYFLKYWGFFFSLWKFGLWPLSARACLPACLFVVFSPHQIKVRGGKCSWSRFNHTTRVRCESRPPSSHL